MKCPKCQKEMEAGFLQTGGKSVIYWADKVRPLNLSYLSKESFVISEEKALEATLCLRISARLAA